MVAEIDTADYSYSAERYYLDIYYTNPEGDNFSNVSIHGTKNYKSLFYASSGWYENIGNFGERILEF